MALPLQFLVSMDKRCFQHSWPSLTLGSLGSFYQRYHKSRVSLWGFPCAHGVLNTPHEEVHDNSAKNITRLYIILL